MVSPLYYYVYHHHINDSIIFFLAVSLSHTQFRADRLSCTQSRLFAIFVWKPQFSHVLSFSHLSSKSVCVYAFLLVIFSTLESYVRACVWVFSSLFWTIQTKECVNLQGNSVFFWKTILVQLCCSFGQLAFI